MKSEILCGMIVNEKRLCNLLEYQDHIGLKRNGRLILKERVLTVRNNGHRFQ